LFWAIAIFVRRNWVLSFLVTDLRRKTDTGKPWSAKKPMRIPELEKISTFHRPKPILTTTIVRFDTIRNAFFQKELLLQSGFGV